jgi:two-component sensor histidine kinase
VATLQSLATSRADLNDAQVAHLVALVTDWGILADLGFSDLVLYLPTWNAGGLVAAAQVRPDTVPTRIPLDVVGTFVPRGRLPQVDRALGTGEVVRERTSPEGTVPIGREAIPVRMPDQRSAAPIAVLARYAGVRDRPLGQLEDAYLRAADELALMVSRGSFPVASGAGSPHRVGEGLLRIDRNGCVTFASPNAQSAMRAMGLTTPLVGAQVSRVLGRILGRPGSAEQAVVSVASGAAAGVLEVEARSGTLSIRSIPLEDSGGALLLVRDVSELRQTERALLSKQATIREVHHRVKNNLQTVAALLRLQARRMPSDESRHALLDAVARVTTIALVHDTLSQESGDEVDFDDVTAKLLDLARDTAASTVSTRAPAVVQSGSCGTLPAVIATPLAMVLSELLLNAAEHAQAARIELSIDRDGPVLRVAVRDDGRGFDAEQVNGLGLQIVRTLVAEQLGGSLTWDAAQQGTRAVIETRVP